MKHTYMWGSWSGKYMTILSMSSSYFLMKEMMEAMEVKAATILLPRLQEDSKACYSPYQLSDGYYNGSWYAKNDEIDFKANCTHEIDHSTLESEIEHWEGLGWVDDHWECEFSVPFVGNDTGVSDVSDLSCSVTDVVGFKIQYFYTGVNNFYFPAAT